jgi:hypothetical protein
VDSPNIIPTTDSSNTKALPRRAATFWTIIALGAALRIYCVFFTNGTGFLAVTAATRPVGLLRTSESATDDRYIAGHHLCILFRQRVIFPDLGNAI